MASEHKQGKELSRRDFARFSATSAAAAGFAIVGSTPTLAKKKKKISRDVLKVGLLGCGGRGTGALENMLEGNEKVVVIALADVFQDKVDAAFEKFKNHPKEQVSSKFAVEKDHCFSGLDAYQKMCKCEVDIIIEGTLPYSRPKHIAAIIDAGKHLFTEKPVAVDPVGIRMVMAAAEKAKEKKLSIVAGTQRRHQKDYLETIAKIHNGEIGDVLAMRAYWCGGLPFARDRDPKWTTDLEYRIRNWYGHCWLDGDSIVEQHVHNLDVCNWVLKGHPERVFASGGRTWKPQLSDEKYGDIYDHFDCDFEYANGVHVFSMCRHWAKCAEGVYEDAIGSKGTWKCNAKGEPDPKPVNPYIQEHIDLIASIKGTGPYLNEGVQVAESTLTAIMGRMSAYTGQVISWEKALKSDLSLVPEDLSFDKKYPVGPVPRPGAPA